MVILFVCHFKSKLTFYFYIRIRNLDVRLLQKYFCFLIILACKIRPYFKSDEDKQYVGFYTDSIELFQQEEIT